MEIFVVSNINKREAEKERKTKVMMCLSPLSRSSSSSSSYEKGDVMNSSDINQSVSKQSSTNQNENVLCMPVSRIPPRAPTARFSVSDSVAFFVAMFLFYESRYWVDYSFVTNKKNKQTLFACVCVLVERRFRILQITKIYAESVCVNKRALERVRVRRNCDDVSSEKFGFFFLSEITQPKKRHKK